MIALRPIGPKENFYIHEGYTIRPEVPHFDATVPTPDEWQVEVYRRASDLASEHGLSSIVDFGCGNGQKLLKYFGELYYTLGLEVEPTLSWLRKRYPAHAWAEPVEAFTLQSRIDILICADVIEHVENPHDILFILQSLKPRYVVLSTPDPTLMGLGTEDGPPKNRHHVREWNMPQFHALVSDYFEVIEHFISNRQQATQCIVAKMK